MTLRQRYDNILDWFGKSNPDASSELKFDSPYQLIVAVMLSAQCTDKRVNTVTPAIFAAYPSPRELAAARFEDLLEMVSSISYPNAKARHLIEMAGMVMSDFAGKIPENVEDLIKLPGVGRKTANVVASICFGAPAIAVDTHVFRVARRLGLSNGRNVHEVEEDLTRNIPETLRAKAHHWIILHGRYVCTARSPFCDQCGLKEWCIGYRQIRHNNIRKKHQK